MCLQQRGVLERADRTGNCSSAPKICFLQGKQRHNLAAEEMVWFYIIFCSTSVGLWKTSVWWAFHLPNASQSPFRALTHTLHPGGAGCPLAPQHCTITARGAFPKQHKGAKHLDPPEFHTGQLSLFMEMSLPFPPSLPVSGYIWWSWRIILSNLPINNEVGEQHLYLSEYSTWTVQLSQHYFQQPFCPTFPTWPTPPLCICTISWWHIRFRGWINAHSANNVNSLRWTMLRMGKKKGH